MTKRKSHALWIDDTLEPPATITVTEPDRTVPTGSHFLRREHEKLRKEAASTKINANESNTKYEEQKQEISDLKESERNKQITLAQLMQQVKTTESDIETTSTNLNNKQSKIGDLSKEALAGMKECEDIASKTAVKEIELAAKELEEQSAVLAFSKSSILIEAHRDIGQAFTMAMKTYFS
jgi:predicted  nucleic acid-binding Zn-ribbon protein